MKYYLTEILKGRWIQTHKIFLLIYIRSPMSNIGEIH